MTTLTMDYYTSYPQLENIQTPSVYERVWSKSPLISIFSQSSKSLSTRIDTALSVLQSKNVAVCDRLLLEDYLANNLGVVTHLYEVPSKVSEYFGDTEMEIGMFCDPDMGDAPEIYIEILTSLSPEEATGRLSLLNREWLFSSRDEDLMKINFTLKFV
jgi:hypothetical protein